MQGVSDQNPPLLGAISNTRTGQDPYVQHMIGCFPAAKRSATDLRHGNTLVIIIQTERSLFIAFPACSRHWCCPSVHSNKLNKWQWTDVPPWTSEKGYLHLWIPTISSRSLSIDSLDKLTSDNNTHTYTKREREGERDHLPVCVCVCVQRSGIFCSCCDRFPGSKVLRNMTL